MALVKSKQLDLSNDYAFTGAVSLTTAPVNANDVVNKTYVDNQSTASSAGLDFKESVTLASTANISATYASGVLTGTANGALTVDGVSVSAGASEASSTRILVKDQNTATDNGIYYCSQTGDASNPFTLTRATDADSSSEINTGCFVFVEDGTDNQNKAFVLQAKADGSSPVLDTDDFVFIQFSGAGQITAGVGLEKSGDTLNFDLGNFVALNSGNYSSSSIGGASDRLMIIDTSDGDNPKELSLYHLFLGLFGNGTKGFNYNTSGFLSLKASSGITVDANGISSALPQLDSGSPASDLSSDGSATGITIGDTPPGDSNVRVTVNGVGVELKGDKTGDAYFSNNSGTDARALADITSGDELIWNGASSYILETSDLVEIFYSA